MCNQNTGLVLQVLLGYRMVLNEWEALTFPVVSV